ncbi:hypothetical protein [Chryseobacterium luquanense]|uniref:pEK499-p136 HEPN domain-containing protein n=1 Tax=Chryseobacterium luquanense TaxID=2983766 RepID=A0ABT3Y3F2_9FLAO|nr:hypothetical protein [Chryseobacterium luquanense]MCX8532680.1 hypothetical protein [Chryseobacterium luquanense]
MEEKQFINQLLNINISEDKSVSTLAIALRGARELSNRNIETGELDKKYDVVILDKQIENKTFLSNKFLAITNYLIIIDLIGNMFYHKNGNENSNDAFKNALSNFTELDNKIINSLKNLRNSLAHQFSLGNDTEIFILDYSSTSDKIIETAEETYHIEKRNQEKNNKNFTTAYYWNICDLVETIFSKLLELNNQNELSILSKYKDGTSIKKYHLNSIFFVK